MSIIMNQKKIGRAAGYSVLVFAVVGLGLGTSGYLSIGAAQDQLVSEEGIGLGEALVGIIFLQSAFTMFFLGPVVAAPMGLLNGVLGDDRVSTIIGSGVGSLFGFYLMIIIGIVVMSMALEASGSGGGGSGGGFNGTLQPALAAGIPTTLVGLITGYVGTRL
jgi:hypothetical protein